MPELNAVLIESRRQKEDDRRFLAALQGVDLDAGRTEDEFKRIQENARKRVEEMTGQKLADPMMSDFISNGIDVETVVEVTNG